ncbi:MAG: guanylate kinase [Muribaculaceae bacterium]|nr:guanylate kinase [Muribaculaceae bacterium]MDE6360885.1 guanylate kinase [Muribaculaceae bacterium]
MAGKLIIISAPSGCGKSTIIGDIMDRGELDLQFSVSATNRKPREGEVDGVNYHFLSDERFQELIAEGAFVEYEQVYPGRYYGTLRSEIENRVAAGHNVILDIDVCGGVNVKELFGDKALAIFIEPPSIEELRNRLVNRGSDSADSIRQRVDRAEYELGFIPKYDHVVTNDELPRAIAEVESLIRDYIKED